MNKRGHSINLVSEKQKGFAEKVIYFLLHYFRYILVLTQIVVIAVFFLRFRIDQQVIDLEESFNQKQEILKIAAPIIEEARAFSTKESYVASQLTLQNDFSSRFNYIFSSVPEGMTIDDYNNTKKDIAIKGKVKNPTLVKAFYERLVKEKKFKSVEILDVTGAPAAGYVFSIEITL